MSNSNNRMIVFASILGAILGTGLLALYPSMIIGNAEAIICNTGQFEGFFVKSSEFCDLQIPEGPQGPQGPPGITKLNSTNVYLVEDVKSGLGTSFRGIAVCQSGDFVLNGGYAYSGFTNNATRVLQDQPVTHPILNSPVTPGGGWVASIFGVPSSVINQFTVSAYCFDNPL